MQMNVSDSVSPALKMRPLTSEEINSVVGGSPDYWGQIAMCNSYLEYYESNGYTTDYLYPIFAWWGPNGYETVDHSGCEGYIDVDSVYMTARVVGPTYCYTHPK